MDGPSRAVQYGERGIRIIGYSENTVLIREAISH